MQELKMPMRRKKRVEKMTKRQKERKKKKTQGTGVVENRHTRTNNRDANTRPS